MSSLNDATQLYYKLAQAGTPDFNDVINNLPLYGGLDELNSMTNSLIQSVTWQGQGNSCGFLDPNGTKNSADLSMAIGGVFALAGWIVGGPVGEVMAWGANVYGGGGGRMTIIVDVCEALGD